MKHQRYFRCLVLCLVFVLGRASYSYAQIDCEALEEVVLNYKKGNLEEVLQQLNDCLEENGTSNEGRWRAYKYIAEIALYRRREEKAAEYVEKMLYLFPEEKLDPAVDLPELVSLYNSYRVSHNFHWGVKATANYSLVNLRKVHSITNTVDNAGVYSPDFGGNAGLAFDFFLNPKLSICAEFLGEWNRFAFAQKTYDFVDTEAVENQWWARLPLSLVVQPWKGKVSPFIRGGGSVGLLLLAEGRYMRRYNGEIKDKLESPVVNIRSQREPWALQAIGGLGCAIRLGQRGLLKAELCYKLGLTPAVRADRRYSLNLDEHFFYVDDDFRLNQLEFGLTYSTIRYQIKKRKPKTNQP